MAQAGTAGGESTGTSIRVKVQKFGSYLSGMVMPNIGAFIAWGLITALFIEDGWLPNERLAGLVDPMIIYLLPLLIAFSGGRMIYGVRGGVVGGIATMGVIVGTDIPMFLGAFIMGPLGGWVIKRFDGLLEGKIRQGFEMLVNNFSAGILGGGLAILGLYGVGPIVGALSGALGRGVEFIINLGLLPLVSIFVEPAKVLFLNNAINHGVLTPLGLDQASQAGKSILFLVETNPGPGLGVLLAYWFVGSGVSKASAPGAAIIHFFGGIHEIYFPYVLMKPALVLAVIAGGSSGLFVESIFNVGLVSTPAPGSIIAILALTPPGNFIGVLVGVATATAASFLVASVIIRRSPASPEDQQDLSQATQQMEEMKGSKSTGAEILGTSGAGSSSNGSSEEESSVVTAGDEEESFDYASVDKVIFACDAGMGSSAMGASLVRDKAKKAGLTDIEVKNVAINDLPSDADVVITHKDLTGRAQQKVPGAHHISVDNFLGSPKYDELIGQLSSARV
ncbi:PTS mannitol transporter subunit IICB [Rubrobacter aplysinae]|uniref:PTS mannitol transporter subunit IICB n=1 Tax=Rubrobacter aplysinae TaxID=909625 RepID=UPI00064BAA65|nr:PTS mannitol transporter subunit IICB [Rubrobacter aplysinae]